MAYHGIPTVLAAANRHADFRALVREKWAECLQNGAFDNVNAAISALTATLRESAAMNGVRWNLFGTSDGAAAATAWENNVGISTGFVADRTAAMNKGLGANGVYVYYDVNGANSGSWATVSVISEIGERITVRAITGNGTVTPPSGKKFYEWNTAPDGSGDAYKPGDQLTLSGECTVLYAIWKTQAEIDAIEAAAAQLAADKAAFETAKTDALAAADAKAAPGDSAAAQKLIADAKAAIAALTYDESKPLAQNVAAATEILTGLDAALEAQRAADAPPTEPADNGGGSSSGASWWQIFLGFLRAFANYFRDLFRFGR
jgi:hypothetical protein